MDSIQKLLTKFLTSSNGEKLSDVPISDRKELELAVASKKAQAVWSKTSLIERAKCLEELSKRF